eukprot:TRINITY_DN863_c0_g1_i1.p1 TRINITY_DN863_c0_g1~~TRINITY_DN863_c0_g1_i1.p1  ORF type:complete len:231 (-),score=30.92 TRINITY_DN863_c0_g1_i1:125-817(-)
MAWANTVPDYDLDAPYTKANITHDLHMYLENRNLEKIEMYLDRYGDEFINRYESRVGWTLLHSACCIEHLESVAYLLYRGADVNSKSFYDWTPLHYAVNADNVEIAQELLRAGAQIHYPAGKSQGFALSPYTMAIANRKTKILKLFHRYESLTAKTCRMIGNAWHTLSETEQQHIKSTLPEELMELCLHFAHAKRIDNQQQKFREKQILQSGSTLDWLSHKCSNLLGTVS